MLSYPSFMRLITVLGAELIDSFLLPCPQFDIARVPISQMGLWARSNAPFKLEFYEFHKVAKALA